MARTTPDKVKEILGDNYDSDKCPSLFPFIERANLLVDRVAECADDRDKSLTAGELKGLETWLSAHFYWQMDRGYTSESTDGASGAYTGQFGQGLTSSPYGQAALDMDYSGCLKDITGGGDGVVQAVVQWLGKPPSSQIDYLDRD